jgi:hypothetical protein
MRWTRTWRGAVRCGAARCSERDSRSCAGGLMMDDGKVVVLSISTRTGCIATCFKAEAEALDGGCGIKHRRRFDPVPRLR